MNYFTVTQPVIYFVSSVSKFMMAPRTPHWDTNIRILNYLRSTPRRSLLYRDNDDLQVKGYTMLIGKDH